MKVLKCKALECKRDADCGTFDTNDRDEQKIAGEAKSDRQRDAKIKGGTPNKEKIEDVVKKAVEDAMKVKPK